MPWGEAALARARREDKPIILSVGYAACHWCHVMAHESFEDERIAGLMNEGFVNIKVDREERPDLDALYQAALHMMGEQGGWPLTMRSDEHTSEIQSLMRISYAVFCLKKKNKKKKLNSNL